MSISKKHLACVIFSAALSNLALAEIYESKDAQGNPVFTDTPTAAGSKEVGLPQTNIADPVKDMPKEVHEAAAKTAPESAANPGHEGESDVVVIGGARNERVEEDIDAHRRHEVLDAEQRHEVGDGEAAPQNKVVGEREFPEHVEGAHPVARPHVGVHRR